MFERNGSEAMRKVMRARSALLRGKPAGRGAFFGSLAMRLDLQENPKIKEATSTNGRVLRFHPDAINALSQDQIVALVAHEVCHCVANHHIRRGNRDVSLWNAAADFSVNLELKDAGFDLPPEGLCDDRFRGMSAERIYSILQAEQPPQQSGGKGQKGSTPQWGGGVEDMPKDSDGEGDDDGDGDGNPGPSKEDIERERREWTMAAVQAATAAQKMGNMPAFAERFIADLHRPKVGCWELLRQYVSETIASDFTWNRPNRRFLSSGQYWPSLQSEDQLGEIVVMIDTSGSIDDKTLQLFGGHLLAICQDFRPQKVHVIYCDAAVNHVDCFDDPEDIKLKAHGGGGTDFRPPFRWVEKHGIDPVVGVYLTDLCGPVGERAPEYPFIWASTTDVKAPWGQTIHIDPHA